MDDMYDGIRTKIEAISNTWIDVQEGLDALFRNSGIIKDSDSEEESLLRVSEGMSLYVFARVEGASSLEAKTFALGMMLLADEGIRRRSAASIISAAKSKINN